MHFIYLFLVIIIILLLLIKPRKNRVSSVAPFIHVNYAHRGLHNNDGSAPENSMPAFSLAVKNGYGIELDIQLTKDEKVVVFHDNDLKRACGINEKVSFFTYDELLQFNLFQSNEKIPLLKDVLTLVNGQIPLLIEVKLPTCSTRTCYLANELLKDYKGKYCIESFHPFAVHWYKKNRPDIIRGQLSCFFRRHDSGAPSFILRFLLTNLFFNCYSKPDFIAYNYKQRKNPCLQIVHHLYHTPIFAWTIKTEESYEICRKEFDSYIFEGFLAKPFQNS